MKKDMKSTSVQLPRQLLSIIQRIAIREGRSVASQIRVLLAGAVKQEAQ
jgi:hypothetical protein